MCVVTGRSNAGDEVLSYHLAFSHNIFLTGAEVSPSWEELDKPEVLKKGIMVVVFSCQRFGYFVLVFL